MRKDPLVEEYREEFTARLNNLLGRDASIPFRTEILNLISESARIRANAAYGGMSNDAGAWEQLIEGAFKFYYREWFADSGV
jgi:hypothetical protein